MNVKEMYFNKKKKYILNQKKKCLKIDILIEKLTLKRF